MRFAGFGPEAELVKYQKFHHPECYQTDHIQVLDIETLAPETEDGSFPPWPLHEAVCASVLTQKKVGDSYEFDIRTVEFANELDGLRQLFGLLDAGATLVTWNGRGFDIPVLQIAAARHLLFADNALRIAWLAPRWAINHADLAELYGRFGGAGRPSLANICRALGIAAKTQGSGDGVAAMIADGREEQVFRYCEEDVAITWLAWLHYAAARYADPGKLAHPLAAFDRWLADDDNGRYAHLKHLRDLPLFRHAREAAPVFRLDQLIERTERRASIAAMRPSAM
ncbi:hypothetical protein [Erythrobacter neustonensis]|uniref:Predicted 3'-5' exonuclease PolB-like domain-containing protein n=1 Tax=Erythrobacter neustonensis TaxID=1112 RepID=A0A192D5F8_9SPHN|nr:hypothetical protein [Erythrobacter neustonensis]ANK13251.1 hypothetical protein A9D12_10195 [Erythrobacter neustonensis]